MAKLKSGSVTLRMPIFLKKRLVSAAAKAGRSVAEETRSRIELSFERQYMRSEIMGHSLGLEKSLSLLEEVVGVKEEMQRFGDWMAQGEMAMQLQANAFKQLEKKFEQPRHEIIKKTVVVPLTEATVIAWLADRLAWDE